MQRVYAARERVFPKGCSSWQRLGVVLAVAAVLGVTSAAAASAGGSAADFVVQAFKWKLGGQYARLWQAVDPGDQRGVNRAAWTACQGKQVQALAGVKMLGIAALRERTVTRTFVPVGKLEATDVTVRVSFEAGGSKQHADADVYVTRYHGSWKAVWLSSDYQALRAGRCPGSGSSGKPTGGSAKTPSGSSQAHTMSAYWFSITTQFATAGQFTAGTVLPTDPQSLGVASHAVIDYWGPGSGAGRAHIWAAGPDRSIAPHDTLAQAAAKFVAGDVGGKVLKGPTNYTLGGKPALAYFGTDYQGRDYGLVLAWIADGSNWGAYTVEMTAAPSLFNRYTNALTAVVKSFRFIR